MRTNNVHYAQKPDAFIITARGTKAIIEFPENVTEVEKEDGVEYVAQTVFSIETFNTDGLKERVRRNKSAWLAKAKEVTPQPVSIGDVVDAINALTDLVIGGM